MVLKEDVSEKKKRKKMLIPIADDLDSSNVSEKEG